MLHSSLQNGKLIKVASYTIDSIIILTIVLKCLMVVEGTYSAYSHSHVKLTARHTFYICTVVQQVIQIGAFFMSVVILIAIRRVLKRKPKC